MSDEQVSQVELLLQVAQQVEDLRLNRNVERRHGLITDDELRPERQGAGDAKPLALAAGKLVRVTALIIGAEPDKLKQLCHPLAHRLLQGARAGLRFDEAMHAQRFGEHRADGHSRVERGERVLKDDLHLAAQLAQLARA